MNIIGNIIGNRNGNGNGILFFHQGWTDIVNCLPLINVFAEKYNTLFVLIREDASPMVSYYAKALGLKVVVMSCPKQTLDTQYIPSLFDTNRLRITGFEYIAHYDHLRPSNDPYRNAYHQRSALNPTHTFERLFYESYGIPYSDRVDKFTLLRDLELEEQAYNRIVKREPYICIHTNPEVGLVDIPTYEDTDILELDKSSYVFFDMVRVLQRAKEIHVIDSVWAAVCYMLDARYGLLSHVPIYIYCHRDFYRMFTQPKELSNWTIIKRHIK